MKRYETTYHRTSRSARLYNIFVITCIQKYKRYYYRGLYLGGRIKAEKGDRGGRPFENEADTRMEKMCRVMCRGPEMKMTRTRERERQTDREGGGNAPGKKARQMRGPAQKKKQLRERRIEKNLFLPLPSLRFYEFPFRREKSR